MCEPVTLAAKHPMPRPADDWHRAATAPSAAWHVVPARTLPYGQTAPDIVMLRFHRASALHLRSSREMSTAQYLQWSMDGLFEHLHAMAAGFAHVQSPSITHGNTTRVLSRRPLPHKTAIQPEYLDTIVELIGHDDLLPTHNHVR